MTSPNTVVEYWLLALRLGELITAGSLYLKVHLVGVMYKLQIYTVYNLSHSEEGF